MIRFVFIAILLPLLLLAACARTDYSRPPVGRRSSFPGDIPATQRPYTIDGKTYYPLPSSEGYVETGIASWYGGEFHGRKTANGETFNMHEMTAAHKTLPMHTLLLVKNLENNRETVVRINDRGPFVKDRIIDLGLAAANDLAVTGAGTAQVRITALGEAVAVGHGAARVERFLPHQDFTAGEFYVQIGSFINSDNAERLKDKMIAQGLPAVIQRFEQDAKVFHRVQVRAGGTLEMGKNMEASLSNSDFPGAFVVAR